MLKPGLLFSPEMAVGAMRCTIFAGFFAGSTVEYLVAGTFCLHGVCAALTSLFFILPHTSPFCILCNAQINVAFNINNN